MDRQTLFDHSIRKLDEVVETPTSYGLVEASAVLRKLLLDRRRLHDLAAAEQQKLVNTIDRPRRRRLRFVVSALDSGTAMMLEKGPVFMALAEGISPRMAIRARTEPPWALNIDQFLNHPVVWVHGQPVKVHEIIDHVAHVEGGVHAGTPSSEIEQALSELNATLSIGGNESVLRCIRGISAVVADTLRPFVRTPPTAASDHDET